MAIRPSKQSNPECEKFPGNKTLHNLEANLYIPIFIEYWTQKKTHLEKAWNGLYITRFHSDFESKTIYILSQIINIECYFSLSKKIHTRTIKMIGKNYWKSKTQLIIPKLNYQQFYTFTKLFQLIFMCQAFPSIVSHVVLAVTLRSILRNKESCKEVLTCPRLPRE